MFESLNLTVDLSTVFGFALAAIGITLLLVLVFKPDVIICTFNLSGIKCEFRKQTHQAKERLAQAAIPQQGMIGQPSLTFGHGIVTEGWNRLSNAVRGAAAAGGDDDQAAQASGIGELLGNLQSIGALTREQADYISLLYGMGKEISGTPQTDPFKQDATDYWGLTQTVTFWLESVARELRAKKHRRTGELKPPPRRHTQVGGYGVFPEPAAGRPAALLVAIGGAMKGHSYAVDRERFHIGSGRENDLTIDGDEFVSGRHAYLRYQQGSLFLFDAGSRNGTFLDDRAVADSGTTLAVGDHIRIGESTFRVDQADAFSGGGPEPGLEPEPVKEHDVRVR